MPLSTETNLRRGNRSATPVVQMLAMVSPLLMIMSIALRLAVQVTSTAGSSGSDSACPTYFGRFGASSWAPVEKPMWKLIDSSASWATA